MRCGVPVFPFSFIVLHSLRSFLFYFALRVCTLPICCTVRAAVFVLVWRWCYAGPTLLYGGKTGLIAGEVRGHAFTASVRGGRL